MSEPARTRHLSPVLGVDALPAVYGLDTEGDCMMPIIAPGTKLVFDRTAEIMHGDFVAVHFRKGLEPAGAYPVQCKQLVSLPPAKFFTPGALGDRLNIAPLGMFQQHFPRKLIYTWDVTRIEALHKCVGRLTADGSFEAVDFPKLVIEHYEIARAKSRSGDGSGGHFFRIRNSVGLSV